MSATVTVTLNGEPRDFPDATTITQLVIAAAATDKGIAVARNGEVVPRSLWGDTAIAAGDHIEMLTAAQGG